MSDIGLVESQIVALFLEALMFGVLIPLYIAAIWVLVNKSDAKRISGLNASMITVSTLLLALGIAHLGLDLHRLLTALGRVDLTPALIFYMDISHVTEVAKTYIYVCQTLTADAFLLFRCFIVWQKSFKMVVVPGVLYLACAVVGLYGTYLFTLVPSDATIFQLISLKPWILSFFALTLATNFTCTCLIAYPIWQIKRRISEMKSTQDSRVWRALAVIVESGAIYSAALLTLLTTYVAGTNAQYPVLDMVNPLIGVVFTLILVRIGLGIASGSETRDHRSRQFSSASAGDTQNRIALRPMAINVSVTRSTRDVEDQDASPNDPDKVISPMEKGSSVYTGDLPYQSGWAA